MSKDNLFDSLPEQASPADETKAFHIKFKTPNRDQIELVSSDLDSLLPRDHQVRSVWAFVESLDLRPLYLEYRTYPGMAGRPRIHPQVLTALWLYATIDGVGSGRVVAELCKTDPAYRWICGGVGVEYRTLNDFRVAHGQFLDRVLTKSVAALAAENLVKLERLSHDGVRVRASAGAASFRRKSRLQQLEEGARQRIATLKTELEADPSIAKTRAAGAKARAARDRHERVKAALTKLDKLNEKDKPRRDDGDQDGGGSASEEAKPADGTQGKKKEPRASTTDVEARVMKMADGGFHPAYNVQFTGEPESGLVVNVDVSGCGSDGGLLQKALDQVEERYGQSPAEMLVDGGFLNLNTIEDAAAKDITIICPPTKSKHGKDPYAIRPTDGPGVREWRERMASDEGKATYRRRGTHELINADLINHRLGKVTVRGLKKVRAVMTWFALAHNLLVSTRLRHAACTA